MAFLDNNGLGTLWGRIKTKFAVGFSPTVSANQTSVTIKLKNGYGNDLDNDTATTPSYINSVTLDLADSTSKAGLMSPTEKSKLAGIAAGAEVNVQSDWNATSGDAFIKNKPSTMPPSSHTHGAINNDGTITPSTGVTVVNGDRFVISRVGSNGVIRATTLSFDGTTTNKYLSPKGEWEELPSGVSPSSTTPAMDGTAAVGTEDTYARGDHVHPSDTSRVPTTRMVNGKALSSDITLYGTDIAVDSTLTGLSVTTAIDNVSEEIENKVDKVDGKGLSTNDYTTDEKDKLAGIASGAEVNVQADWNESDSTSDAYINNKPTNVSTFANDVGYLTSYTETDPTVPAWAKESTKPTYTASEVGAASSSHSHGNLTNAGILRNSVSVASGDQLVITDHSASGKLTPATISFGSSTTTFLANDGSWRTPSGGGGGITTETDPTVPAWAKASTKPSYTASEVGALPKTGGQVTGDITLYVASGNSPGLIFQRGTLTDNYNDWKIYDKGGYLYFAQRGSGSSSFNDMGYISTTGVLTNFTIPWGSVTGKPTILTEPTMNTSTVSSGGSGTWRYRTWPSGWQEAWYQGSIQFTAAATLVGGWYRSTKNFALPISFADDASILVSGATSGRVYTHGGIKTNGTQFEAQILGGAALAANTYVGWNVYVAGYGRS